MRHVMVFTRTFRSPLQATFSPSENDSLDELCRLLEMADERTRRCAPGGQEE